MLLGLFILLVLLDLLIWTVVLGVAGTVGLVKRLYHDLTSYR